MTEKEIVSIIKILKAYYPYYYRGITPEEAQTVVTVWKVNFEEIDYELVEKAVHKWGRTNKTPPTIADIRQGIFFFYNEYKDKYSQAIKENADEYEIERLKRLTDQAWNSK